MNIGAVVSFLVMLLFGVGVLAMAVETWQLAHQQEPITGVTRKVIVNWPGPSITGGIIMAAGLGALAAHFFWDAACG